LLVPAVEVGRSILVEVTADVGVDRRTGMCKIIGWNEKWICDPTDGGCGITHRHDDNAAVNLARYEETSSVVGPVRAAVKRGADRKTGPRPAGGREARKGTGHPAGEQPRDRVRVA